MNAYKWLDETKDLHLRIEDLKYLPVNEWVEIVVFDRNFIDDKPTKNITNPAEYLKDNRAKLKYNGDLTWDIAYSFGETVTQDIEFDVSFLPTNYTWVPLKDGWIRITDSVQDGIHGPRCRKSYLPLPRRLNECGPIHMRWDWFRLDTRIGWRGPMMYWDDVVEARKYLE